MTIRLFGILFLDPAGVGQHDPAQVVGAAVQKTRPRNPCDTSRGRYPQ